MQTKNNDYETHLPNQFSTAHTEFTYDCTGDVRYYNSPRLVVEHHRGSYNSKPLFGGLHPRAPLSAKAQVYSLTYYYAQILDTLRVCV